MLKDQQKVMSLKCYTKEVRNIVFSTIEPKKLFLIHRNSRIHTITILTPAKALRLTKRSSVDVQIEPFIVGRSQISVFIKHRHDHFACSVGWKRFGRKVSVRTHNYNSLIGDRQRRSVRANEFMTIVCRQRAKKRC